MQSGFHDAFARRACAGTPLASASRRTSIMPDAHLHSPTSPLAEEIARRGPWFHNLRLDGIETAPDHPLGDHPAVFYREFAPALPADLHGWSVLDIGCNAGFYSFEMKR